MGNRQERKYCTRHAHTKLSHFKINIIIMTKTLIKSRFYVINVF